jgi:hypothetical protein
MPPSKQRGALSIPLPPSSNPLDWLTGASKSGPPTSVGRPASVTSSSGAFANTINGSAGPLSMGNGLLGMFDPSSNAVPQSASTLTHNTPYVDKSAISDGENRNTCANRERMRIHAMSFSVCDENMSVAICVCVWPFKSIWIVYRFPLLSIPGLRIRVQIPGFSSRIRMPGFSSRIQVPVLILRFVCPVSIPGSGCPTSVPGHQKHTRIIHSLLHNTN